MRTILIMIRKEFLQIFRDKQMLPMIFVLPIIQLILLVYAATMDINNVDFVLVDMDKSSSSRELVHNFSSTGIFNFKQDARNSDHAIELLAVRKAKMALIIPSGFEKDIVRGENPKIQFLIDAENGSTAGIIQSYASIITIDYNKNILAENSYLIKNRIVPQITTVERYWYNPELDYKQYMAPGILVILVTFIGMFLTAISVVHEKELGTIEQLNVTPIKKYQFLIGKMLPFWLIGLFELTFGLGIAKLIFDIPILGNIFLLLGLTALYMMVVLAAALLISTITDTQQQAMFISWFFVVIFILMSGLFTPISSMPKWAQTITDFNPIAHFIEIMRRILLKGAGFNEIREQFYYLVGFAVVMMSLSVWRYRKSSK